MNGQTRQLAQYAAGLGFGDIPSHVIGRLKLHLLDAAGAAIYGGQLPWTVIVKSVVSAWRGNPEATVWNTDIRVPASQAAFINSVATHAFELDDRRVASYMHPASATFPAGLAVSESLSRKVNGQELLTAIVAGYEVGLRVGKAIGRGSAERGFYPPGIGGAFAAVVTAGRLWGLSEQDFPHAFNVTATQVSGLYSPTMIKRLNIGAGTHSGMIAAELTRAGYKGVSDIFETDAGGVCAAYANNPDLSLLVDGLGREFETGKVELKPYVSSRPNHTAIDCILELRNTVSGISEKGLESIDIEIGSRNYAYGAGFDISSVPQALMSVAYCVCVAFLDGDAFLDQFTEARLQDSRLQDLLKITRVIKNPEFDNLGLEKRDMTIVRCKLRDGRELKFERAFAKGHPTNPLSHAEVVDKFRRLVRGLIDSARMKKLEDLILNLDSVKDVKEVALALGATS